MLEVVIRSLTIWMKSSSRSIVGKIFAGEMLLRTLSTTLLQNVCYIVISLQVIVKDSLDPDDNFNSDMIVLPVQQSN